MKSTIFYIIYLFALWLIYRLSGIVVSQELDEFVVKPVIWLLPIFFILKKEKKNLESLGFTKKNLIPGIYLSVILGLLFAVEALVVSYFKKGTIAFSANLGDQPLAGFFVVSLATAVSEETVFRGFLFQRFWNFFKNEILSNLLTSILWVFIHVPASFALLGYSFTDSVSFWFLAFIYSIGACFIFSRTKNIYSAILLYVLWEAPLILFR